MKKMLLIISTIIVGIITFTACSKSAASNSSSNTFTCSGIDPKFSNDIQPILTTVCSINSNCHAGGSTNSGGPLTSYTEVNAKKANIRAQILAGTMPQSGSITQSQINAFICWIDNGAINN